MRTVIAERVHPTTNPFLDLLGVSDASVGEDAATFAQELLAAGVVVLAPVGQLNADLGC